MNVVCQEMRHYHRYPGYGFDVRSVRAYILLEEKFSYPAIM
jgi:hypothetical protein